MDIQEALAAKRPPAVEVRLVLDQSLVTAWEAASRAAMESERSSGKSNDPKIHAAARLAADRLQEAKAAMLAAEVTFKFQGIGRKRFTRLLEAAPPTPGSELEFDTDLFVAPLLAACAVDPSMTLEQAQTIVDDWTEAEVTKLFMAAWAANRMVKDVPFTEAASEPMRLSEQTWSTAALEESLTESF